MSEVEPSFRLFVLSGTVSIPGSEHRCFKILWDTGAAQSASFSDAMLCCLDVLVQGMEMGLFNLPLHHALLQIALVSGLVRVGVCDWLPVRGVEMILGNDLAGGK